MTESARYKPPPSVHHALDDHHKYRRIRDLGAGAFGCVQLCHDIEAGRDVAVKLIARGPRTVNEYVISELYEVFLTPCYLGIAMEYANGGNTFDYVTRHQLSEEGARWIFQQLIMALDYCHKKGIVNRDLKLENSLLHWETTVPRAWGPMLKLCDFGFSKNEATQALLTTQDDVAIQSVPRTRVGTPNYMPPEIIVNSSQHRRPYDGKLSDIWSAGVILYVLLYKKFPFQRREDKQLSAPARVTRVLERIEAVDYVFPHDPPVSLECKDLVSKLLVKDPAKRLRIEHIFKHPWFLRDLPEGALEMNQYASTDSDVPDGLQSVQEIEDILSRAQEDPVMGRALLD